MAAVVTLLMSNGTSELQAYHYTLLRTLSIVPYGNFTGSSAPDRQ